MLVEYFMRQVANLPSRHFPVEYDLAIDENEQSVESWHPAAQQLSHALGKAE
jgi:hypothetical protein